ncbi:hypothetical protein [Saccharothrix hoggarensis]|uniref:Cupin domain-containing protein n=1 Tax=Saccharothrix hoggarensis TaxID=913853 RepID=A0ABW3R262_9PSEU
MTFDVRVVTVPDVLPYDAREWRDALVVVLSGTLDLDGELFPEGSVLALAGLPLEVLRRHGEQPAVLVAVTRPEGDEAVGEDDAGEAGAEGDEVGRAPPPAPDRPPPTAPVGGDDP